MTRSPAALIVLLALSSLGRAADDERFKLPTAEERAAAAKLVRDLFKADYAKTTPPAKLALAAKLYKQAGETKDDLAAQFALLHETVELAAAGGNVDLAIEAAETLLRRFEGPPADLADPLYKTIAAKATTADAGTVATGFLVRGIEERLAAEDADAADRLQKMAETTAARSKNVKLAKTVQVLAKDIETFRANKAAYDSALEALKADPDDGKACAVAGQFLCFQKSDWPRGLAFLAKCSDPKLKAAATKDLDAADDDGAAAAAAADGWYDVLLTLDGWPKRAAQVRVYAFYSKAAANLTGLSKVRVDKRLEELEKTLDGRLDYPKLWPVLRTAARKKTYDTLAHMGGAFGKKEYEETPPEGAILVGFHYTLRKFGDKDLIDCFQPIYLTMNGEKLGAAYGNFKGGKTLTVKAKPGYAIGKMAIRGGGLWGGTNVHFMRIQGAGLNSADTYETGWIGHKDQPESPFLGDGRPIIGIHGTLQNDRDGGGICSIGLHLVGDKPAGKSKK